MCISNVSEIPLSEKRRSCHERFDFLHGKDLLVKIIHISLKERKKKLRTEVSVSVTQNSSLALINNELTYNKVCQNYWCLFLSWYKEKETWKSDKLGHIVGSA